jgi:hypothetical protein
LRYTQAARVALHYNRYSLEDALCLSAAEQDLLLAVVTHEKEEQWERLGRVLGTSWSIRELIAESPKTNAGKMPSFVDIPLTLALAPQLLKKLSDEYRTKYQSTLRAEAEGHGPVVEIATMDSRAARELYKRISSQVAAAQPE